MKLHYLRIEQLRQFRAPLELEHFTPGINLFTGPNESGKSTVVRAIRAAFFERYKSSSVNDLQPWGDSGASPRVDLQFDWRGARWTLTKSFLRHKRCDLRVGDQSFSGEEAEEKLSALLGYDLVGRGASRAEHWGIPGLLWIEQGTGQDIQVPVRHAGRYLKSILGESLGEVASSAGDALLQQVERERLKLLTARKGAPTGELAESVRECEAYQEQLDAMDADIAAYRQQVDRLEDLNRQQRDDATRPWEAYRAQAAQARAQLAEVQAWVQAQQRDEQMLQHCLARQQMCRDQLAACARQQEDLARRDALRREAGARLESQQQRGPAIATGVQQAQDAYRAADQAWRRAQRAERYAALRREQRQLAGTRSEWEKRLAQARQLLAPLRDQRAELQSLRVDAAALKRLQSLTHALQGFDIRQQAVATRLQFALLPGQQLLLDGAPLLGEGERWLLQGAELQVPGVGRLQIQPGGEDLADLARRREAAQEEFRATLDALQVDDLAQAEAQAARRGLLQAALTQAEALLATLVPEGVDALGAQLAQLREQEQSLQTALEALGEPPADPAEGAPGTEAQRDAAREALRQAEQAAGQYEQALGLARQTVANAQAEWERAQALTQSVDHAAQEQALSRQLVEQGAQEVALREALTQRGGQIEAARPDILAQDVQRFDHTATVLQARANERALELATVRSRLETMGASGLEEQRAELARHLETSARRRDELQRRAAALDLLMQLLTAERQALARRIQAPLQRHLQHYLQILFAESRLTVGEDLGPEQLVRGGGRGESHADYDALSFGAREQMGLISRLAYADLLKDAGRPTLIILDDALVHSDARRLAQMKRILFDAAQRHQILLFSCHPDRWRDLGASPVEIGVFPREP